MHGEVADATARALRLGRAGADHASRARRARCRVAGARGPTRPPAAVRGAASRREPLVGRSGGAARCCAALWWPPGAGQRPGRRGAGRGRARASHDWSPSSSTSCARRGAGGRRRRGHAGRRASAATPPGADVWADLLGIDPDGPGLRDVSTAVAALDARLVAAGAAARPGAGAVPARQRPDRLLRRRAAQDLAGGPARPPAPAARGAATGRRGGRGRPLARPALARPARRAWPGSPRPAGRAAGGHLPARRHGARRAAGDLGATGHRPGPRGARPDGGARPGGGPPPGRHRAEPPEEVRRPRRHALRGQPLLPRAAGGLPRRRGPPASATRDGGRDAPRAAVRACTAWCSAASTPRRRDRAAPSRWPASSAARSAPRWCAGAYPDLGDDDEVARAPARRWPATRLVDLEDPDERRFAFGHAVTRDVAYDSLPYGIRTVLHGRIGDALEQEPDGPRRHLDLLVHHYTRSEDIAQQRRYLLAAAEAARATYAVAAAVDHLQQVLPLVEPEERPGRAAAAGRGAGRSTATGRRPRTPPPVPWRRPRTWATHRSAAQAPGSAQAELHRKQGRYAEAADALAPSRAGLRHDRRRPAGLRPGAPPAGHPGLPAGRPGHGPRGVPGQPRSPPAAWATTPGWPPC